MSTIKEGSVLRLHGEGLYRVGAFCIKIGESGSHIAMLEMTELDTNIVKEYPVRMVEDLVQRSHLYPHGEGLEDFMTRIHNARRRKSLPVVEVCVG